jgi:acyl-CoA synthetase (AMP-forming)/AMP-acid ligase II
MGEYLRVEQVIDAAAAATPDKVALVCGARRWTYREVRAERDRRAGVLVEAGLRVGERVVTAERVADEHVLAFLACARAGGVLACLSPLLTAGEQAPLAARLGPALALTATGEPHPGLPLGTPLPIALPGEPSAAAVAEAGRRSAAGTAEDAVSIRHTSGTGQFPKLVLRGHRQLTWLCDTLPWLIDRETVYCLAPTTMLFVAEVCLTFRLGATLVIPRTLGVAGLEEELAARGVTALYTTPALLGALLRREPPPPTLRLAIVRTIGAALAPEVQRAAEARYAAPVCAEYGMAECSVVMGAQGPGVPPGSSGTANPGVAVRLIDGAGDDVPAGATGELIVRSPGVMLGYLDDPQSTAAVLRDGWFHTGDSARRDADGFYHLEGRRGLLINVGGLKVVPEEVEAVLSQHPGVREAVVLAQPDPLRGEVVRAVVVPTGQPLDAQALRRFCRAYLAGYKVPRSIEFRAEPLPRSALGKVLRHQL